MADESVGEDSDLWNAFPTPVTVEHMSREEERQDAQLRLTREVDEFFIQAPASNPTMARRPVTALGTASLRCSLVGVGGTWAEETK